MSHVYVIYDFLTLQSYVQSENKTYIEQLYFFLFKKTKPITGHMIYSQANEIFELKNKTKSIYNCFLFTLNTKVLSKNNINQFCTYKTKIKKIYK